MRRISANLPSATRALIGDARVPSRIRHARFMHSTRAQFTTMSHSNTPHLMQRSLRQCFTSAHIVLKKDEVRDLLTRYGLEFKDKGSELVVKECPKCTNTKGDATNQYKLSIQKDKGVFHCFRCEIKGTWFELKKIISGIGLDPLTQRDQENEDAEPLSKEEMKKLVRLTGKTQQVADLVTYLKGRGLTKSTAEKFNVTASTQQFQDENLNWVERECIAFPWFDETGAQVRVKYRGIADKKDMRISPKGGKYGFFGYNMIEPGDKEVVLTEGEFDAMAVFQSTGRKALSLPNGARSLPPSLLPLLEQFERVYLWLDDDKAGREGVQMCLAKLGANRCFVVKSRDGAAVGPKDANECLLKKDDLENIIKRAKLVNEDAVISIRHMRQDIFAVLSDPDKGHGTPYTSFPTFTSLIKGHRRGELSIFTGRTGMGKTTLLSQLSLDLAMQGVATLWGSFEIPNIVLASKMMRQFAHGPIPAEQQAGVYDRFEELPIHFLKFWNNTDILRVIDAMDFAVYKHDIEHIVIDNLQFMVGVATGSDKFDRQDDALSKFRLFASTKNVHVSLVVHPRKEDETMYLTNSSVFGTAKATQEADNVIIIQTDPSNIERRYIDVRKNRYDGKLGRVDLEFDPVTTRYAEKKTVKRTGTRIEFASKKE